MLKLTCHYTYWPDGLPHTVNVPEDSPYGHLAANAARQPGKTAIEYYGRQITYAELHQAVLSLTSYLQQTLGVKSGDRVLILMQNCPQFIIAYYAVLRAGAVVVAINPMSSVEETTYYVEDSGARVAIVMQDMLSKIQSLIVDRRLTACVTGAYSEMAGSAQNLSFMGIPPFVTAPREAVHGEYEHDFSFAVSVAASTGAVGTMGRDLAVIAYTSGTTGKPKGAMLSHRALSLAAVQRALWLDDGAERADLLILPMCHIAGMSAMNQAVFQGRTIILLSRWDSAAVPELIARHHVGRWGAVAPMLIELLATPELGKHDFSSLRRLYVGATATPSVLAEDISRRLGVNPIECYGMTETCGSTHINPPQHVRSGSVGIPQVDVDARVIDLCSETELGCNQSGEIVINCPTQFSGYWNKPEAAQEAFIEIEGKRFVRTGDIGHFDEDGYFYITDRIKRMINASGLKVWPSEVEACLSGHPAVQEACVISAYDEYRGETVKALIILKPGVDPCRAPEEITKWARKRLAAYKIPRQIEFVKEFPRTLSGKVMWRYLQESQCKIDKERRQSALQ